MANKNSWRIALGVNSVTSNNKRQADDFYATAPKAAKVLMDCVDLAPHVWEPACGQGHLARELGKRIPDVLATDLYNRGYGTSGIDFFKQTKVFDGDIVTNPPFKYAKEFILHALSLVNDGAKVCMFLKITFLESAVRYKELFSTHPPKHIFVCVKRMICAKDGDFVKYKTSTTACYAWYVWEKGYKGSPSVGWCNYE